MEVVGTCPHVSENERPEVDDGQAVGVNGTLSLLGDEVIHHAQEACGEKEADGVVAIPPLHHGVLNAREDGNSLGEADGYGCTTDNMQQGNRQDEGTVKPVGDIDVFDLASHERPEEHDRVGHPSDR